MKPATNLREIVRGVWCWSSFHEDWKVDLSSCAWNGGDGLVLIDPVKLADENLATLEHAGKPAALLLTNQNHERDAEWFRHRYSIPIQAHRDAVPGIEIAPDAFFCDGAKVAGGLTVVHLPGASPSESAFYTAAHGGIIFSGDVVVTTNKGLVFLPDQYCENPKQNRESAKKLLGYQFDTLTVAHGNPVYPGAKEQFARLFPA